MIHLPAEWKKMWESENLWEKVFSLTGEEFRNKDGRRTFRFLFAGEPYFAKLHGGVGIRRIVKDLLRLRLPVLGAENEWLAIRRLEELGVLTMALVGYGKTGINPATQRSFVITRELVETESLEDFCQRWKAHPPAPRLKRALITEVARIARTLHENGLNHRDLYICHFLLDVSQGRERLDPSALKLHLIDLHRVQMRPAIPLRWRIKDIASLHFSSMGIGLTVRDRLRFIRVYTGKPLKEALAEPGSFWKTVEKRALSLHREFIRKHG